MVIDYPPAGRINMRAVKLSGFTSENITANSANLHLRYGQNVFKLKRSEDTIACY